MRSFALLCLFIISTGVNAQSGRSVPVDSPTPSAATGQTVKQLFEEVNAYSKLKFTEYAEKKVNYSDALLEKTKLEQRQLAAKYAATAGLRKNLAGEDFYYLGMLHWIAENLDGAAENLLKFIATENVAAARAQTSRSIVVVVYAKRKKVAEAEKLLAEYLANEPAKVTELARMESELAKAYQAAGDFVRMAPHAEAGYRAAKDMLKDPDTRARAADEILDAGMLVFEAYRDGNNREKAEAALDDMRALAVTTASPSFYYYAVDQKIKYLIDTGRKPAALELYASALTSSAKDFPNKGQQSEVDSRLRRREKHYRLLGETPPEMPLVDRWFPGTQATFADMHGKVILLDFWATWCGPCYDSFPELSEWSQAYEKDGLVVLGITRYYDTQVGFKDNMPGEIAMLKSFRENHKMPYDFVVGKDQSIQFLYGATALPTAVLIDRKGIVRYIETGTSTTRIEQMREMMLKLLAEK